MSTFMLIYLLTAVSILIPNRIVLVHFGGISGVFGQAMVRILARHSRVKIPMARPNEPDMPPKRTKRYDKVFTVPKLSPKFSVRVTPTPLFQSECLSTCRRSWRASFSLVLGGTFFAPLFDRKTPAKS